MTEHLTTSGILDLLRGELEAPSVQETYGHLAYCDACAGRVRAAIDIHGDFDGAWSEFVASFRGERFSLSISLILDQARAAARIASNLLGSLSAAHDLYSITPVALPAGAGESGKPFLTPMAEIQILGPRIGSATVVADAGRNVVSVLLRPPPGMALETFHAELAPRAVLFDPERDLRHESRFTLVEGADYLLAEFEGLEQARWILGLDLGL